MKPLRGKRVELKWALGIQLGVVAGAGVATLKGDAALVFGCDAECTFWASKLRPMIRLDCLLEKVVFGFLNGSQACYSSGYGGLWPNIGTGGVPTIGGNFAESDFAFTG